MNDPKTPAQIYKADAEWRAKLSNEEYRVTRACGTEPPFTGRYWDHHEEGVYQCVCCGTPLFSSTEKYDSGSGWPSYWAPIDEQRLKLLEDRGHGMVRIEVRCGSCDAHLGHVFEDGPRPTGLRYCINSASLRFEPA